MIVGIDIGKNKIKVAYLNEVFSFPHLIGEGRDRTIQLNKKIPINNIDVTYEGHRYFVGELAKESYIQFASFEKNHVNEYTKILLLASLSLLPDTVFDIVIGLPIADYKTQKKTLTSLLLGEARVNNKFINVRNVSVFPQGLGGLYSQYLSSNGKQMREFPTRIGGVDIGFKDFNFCVLDNGEFNNAMSWSFPLGMHTAYMSAIPELNNDSTINDIKPEQVPSIIYDNLKDKIINLINPYWKQHDFPIHSLGGGSYWIKIGKQVDNPIFANAIGFKNIGMMKHA